MTSVRDRGAPSLWFHDGVSYIVAASQLGNVACVRVADGKVMWKLTGKAYNGHSITVAGDYMVINEVGEAKKYKSAQLGAYKLTPKRLSTFGPCPRSCTTATRLHHASSTKTECMSGEQTPNRCLRASWSSTSKPGNSWPRRKWTTI